MGWTKPRTWIDQETLIASIFNTHIRDNLDFLRDKDRVHAVHSEDNELKDDEWECLRFDDEAFDRGDMHSNRKRNRRVRVNNDGLYLIILKVNFVEDTTGERRIMLRKNSDESETGGQHIGTWSRGALTGNDTIVTGSRLHRFSRGDHVNAFARQNSGAKLDTIAGQSATFLQLVEMGG